MHMRARHLISAAAALALSACAAPRATGDLSLAYPMTQAGGEKIPYRLYVPGTWSSGREWPLVVVLHGFSGNASSPFDDAGGQLQRLAEQHGFVVVSPNGYNGMADYGANLRLPSVLNRDAKPLQSTPERESALAEADVLNVLARVSAQYHIDTRRIYLMGNSMGMTGALHLAEKMPKRWCAISASAGPPWPDYPVERLKPISAALFVHGGQDQRANPSDTQALTERAKAAGVDARMQLIPEGTHGDAWVRYLPETFDFFAQHDCSAR
jgi:poly(3-hydroxybutyrate) depolymerase